MLIFCNMNKIFTTLILACLTFIYSNAIQADTYQNVVVIKDADIKINGKYITDLKFKESGFTSNCSYVEVIKKLKIQAFEKGGNLIQIIKHKKPDAWSSCHRITVSIYKVGNIKQYEQRVYWSESRKLTWDDFRTTSDDDLLMSAESYCELSYQTNSISSFKKVKYFVHTSFIPNKSWVKEEGKQSVELLNHEQRHFDLWEIYARLLYKELTENKKYHFSRANADILFRSIHFDGAMRQNAYDKETDHGLNVEAQKHWDYLIDKELDELSDYADHY